MVKLEVIEKKSIGEQKGILVFVHGVCHGAWTWENFMNYFPNKGYDCYALSLRGHSNSEGRESLNDFSLNDYAQDVMQVISPFEGDAIVIGHSMGGAIVQKLICENPGYAKAAILLATVPPCGQDEQVVKDMIMRSTNGINGLAKLAHGETITLEELAQCSLFGGRIPIEIVEKFSVHLQPESKRALDELFLPVSQSYNHVKIPVGVIGSSNDLIFADREHRLTAKAYGTKAVILKDLCHDVMFDPEWEKAADAIMDFLLNLTI